MRTARSLTIYPSMLCSGGVAGRGGMPGPGVPVPGDACSTGWLVGQCLLQGLPGLGGVPGPGVPGPGGGGCGIPACTEADPPWREFFTHAAENITLPQTSFAGGNDALLTNV